MFGKKLTGFFFVKLNGVKIKIMQYERNYSQDRRRKKMPEFFFVNLNVVNKLFEIFI